MKNAISIITSQKRKYLNKNKFNKIPNLFALFFLMFCFVVCNNFCFAQISRTQIVNNANSYVTFSWTANSCNLWNGSSCGGRNVYAPTPANDSQRGWVKVGSNTSMPYAWGGGSTTAQHISAMASCKSAGDICSIGNAISCISQGSNGAGLSCTSGLDCSGLVTRAWGLNTPHLGTGELPSYSTIISLSQTQPGDILNDEGHHVRLVSSNNGSSYTVIESSGTDWKTAYHTYTPVNLTSYDPRCPNSSIVTGGCGSVSAPSNDNCSSAITLTPNTSCNTTSGDIAGATQSYAASGCSSGLIQDVWYKFTATSNGTYTIRLDPSSSMDGIVEVRQGSCSGTILGCADSGGGNGGIENLNVTVTNGTIYYIRIYEYNSAGNTTPPASTTFDICVIGASSTPPPNDNCASAITLTPNTSCNTTSGDIAGATQSYAASGCSSGLIQDVWYKFTATSNGTYTIMLDPSSSMDGILEVRQGSCTGTVLGCADDGGGNGGIENLDVSVTNGTTYYIRVYEYNSAGNTTPPATTGFDICITRTATNYTISTSSNPSAGGTTSGSGSYQSGQSRTVTATANSGYTFSNWSENGTSVSTNSSYTFTLSGNRTLVANFTQNIEYNTISTSSSPSAGGTTSGSGTYQSGQSRTVTATANNGYTFSNWSESGTPVSTSSSYTFTLSGNRTLVANFTSGGCISPSITTHPSVRNVTAPNGTSFNITASGSNNLYHWEMSTGFTWYDVPNSSPYSGVNTETLTISSTTTSMNGYQYRCVVTSSCNQSAAANSNGATLTVNPNSGLCTDAVVLTCGQIYNGNTVSGASNISMYNCASDWIESGPEKVHVITTTSTGDLTATLSNLGVDLDVFILGSCSESACLAFGNDGATYTNAPPGIYYIVVDGYDGASGSYTLTINCGSCIAPYNGIISPGSPTVSAPNSINLTVSAEGTSPFNYQWYWWNGSDWTALTNISPYSGTTTQTLNINPTSISMDGYYYTCVVSNLCGYQNDINSVQLTVNSSCTPPTSPTSATASQTTINLGQSTTLQVNGGTLNDAPNWVWYTGGCGGTQVGTGATLSVSPTITTTYYVQASACETTTTCRSVTITVNSDIPPVSPTSATASQTTINLGQSTTLQVNGGALNSAPNWVWYTGGCGGTQVGTGATLSVSPTTTTTYYVQASALGTTTTCRLVTITVNLCQPTWQPVQNQQYNMNVISKLYLSDVLTTNPADAIGAFVGQECRGIAYPDASFNGNLFLTITSNVQSGETITFKAWKSSPQCEECLIAETMPFVNQSEIGAMNNPFEFHCGMTQLSINFGAGYTWFSVNVNPGSMTLNSLFNNITPCENDRIIGQQAFATYFGTQWVGSLTTIDPTAMYKMKLCSQQTWTKPGSPVSIAPMTIASGYPWIGYLPQNDLPINSAITNISPAPVSNDRFNGQSSFASYSGSQWVGSLTTLQKGKGFIIHLANSSVLTYPNGMNNSPVFNNQSSNMITLKGDKLKPNPLYNMQMIANIILSDGSLSINPDDVVYAYVSNECRGMAKPVSEVDGRLFLSVGSDIKSGEEVTFKVYLANENRMYDLNNGVVFLSEMETGTMQSPYQFKMAGLTGIPLILNDQEFWVGEIYPNPFDATASLEYKLEKPGKIKAKIINGLGEEIQIVMNTEMEAGTYVLKLNGAILTPGFYYLLMTYTNDHINSVISKKMVIK